MSETVELMPDNLIYHVVVYKNPKDYPSKYVARRFNIVPSGPVPTNETVFGDSIREVRAKVMDNYPDLIRTDRTPEDEKQIYEVWI